MFTDKKVDKECQESIFVARFVLLADHRVDERLFNLSFETVLIPPSRTEPMTGVLTKRIVVSAASKGQTDRRSLVTTMIVVTI